MHQVEHMSYAELSESFDRHVKPEVYSKYFREDFLQGTGVNLLSHKFDHEASRLWVSTAYQGKAVDVVLLHCEDSERWDSILKPWVPNIQPLSRANTMAKGGGIGEDDV